ncbi:DBH-like monooxygenase protein 1 homolog [Penaeus japonicus]|uniref:DBH-like monooxygenase protein 1 homolog n=1 Tax=Penaeus japonicus TaxID=27405 RepID=UPI001C70E3D2|nr:DBH-like monooxygenase protein 1 homolog [Penaeus japonicus]
MWNVTLLLLLATLRISGAEDVTAKNKTYLEQRQEHEDSKMVGMEEEDVYLSHPHSAALDPDGKFHLSWTVDSNSQEITIEVVAETLGWLALGFSPSEALTDVDLLTAWVDDEGTGHIQDRHGPGDKTPQMDDQQDWRLVRASENDTHTLVVVVRDLNTCDDQDLPLLNTTKRLIYAYGATDPANATSLEYLGADASRGSRYLLLLQPPAPLPTSPEDTRTWSLSQSHSLAKDQRAVHWCNIVRFPHVESQVHYVGFDIQHSETSRAHLHQLTIWECAGDPNSAAYRQERERLMHYASQQGHECYSPNMPLDYNSCNNPVIVWATGAEGAREPTHVGLPMLPKVGEYAFFLVEAHYDNSLMADSIGVQWGLDVYYTEQLREFESASMFVGNTINFAMLIPPGRDHWTATGHCPAGCLLDGMPETGIKVYQVFLKAHALARNIRVRHFRDDKELPPLVQDDYYDSNFHYAMQLQEERTILPSDHITTECTYDSTSRSNTTFSGYGADSELCLAVLSYYPRHSLVECTSSTYHDVLKEVLGIKQFQNEQNLLVTSQSREPMDLRLPKRNTDFRAFVNGLTWSEVDLEALEEQLSRGTHVARCMRRGGVPAQAIKLKTSYPEAAPYAAPELACPRMLGQKIQHAGASSVSAFSLLLLVAPVLLALVWQ